MNPRNMKLIYLVGWSAVLSLSATMAVAQEATNSATFNQQLKELREFFEKQQREQRESFEKQQRDLREEFDKKFREQESRIEALTRGTNVPPSVAETNA